MSSTMRFRSEVASRASFLTRAGVAKQLGVSPTTVRRYEQRGLLRPIRDQQGIYRFDSRDVLALAHQKGQPAIEPVDVKGNLAAHVFTLLKKKTDFVDIVIETRQQPEVIRELVRAFKHGLNFDLVKAREEDERRAQSEHEEMMREWDRMEAGRRSEPV